MKMTRATGLTILEMTISLAVLGIILASVFSIAIETYSFVGDNEVDFSAQNEANQAFSRLAEILRKSGWNTNGGVTYPRVLAGGAELEFRVLRDLDGNGYPFDTATGALEWGPTVYSIRADAGGTLSVYDGPNAVWHLARYVDQVSFATYLENKTLQIKEIGFTLTTRKVTRRGEPIQCSVAGTFDMRN